MNTRMKVSIASAALAALFLAACQRTAPAEMKTVTTEKSGDLKITLLSSSGELTRGQNQFQLAFHNAQDQPVNVGTVTVSSSMTMPGMAPMVASLELKPTAETGQYSLQGSFDMSGAWKFEIRWDGPAGQGSASFNTNVR